MVSFNVSHCLLEISNILIDFTSVSLRSTWYVMPWYIVNLADFGNQLGQVTLFNNSAIQTRKYVMPLSL